MCIHPFHKKLLRLARTVDMQKPIHNHVAMQFVIEFDSSCALMMRLGEDVSSQYLTPVMSGANYRELLGECDSVIL